VEVDSAGYVEEWMPLLVSLQGTDTSDLVLNDIDLRWCRFAGAHHLDRLRIEGRSPFHHPPRGWRVGHAWPPAWRWTRRQVIAEEHAWRLDTSSKKAAGWQQHPAGDDPAGMAPQRLAALYRSLRKALEDSKDEAGAGDFYFGEMEARRHSGNLRDRAVLTGYWLLSGYGQRALRAVVGLGVLVAVITILLLSYGLPSNSVAQSVTGTLQTKPTGQSQTPALQANDPGPVSPASGQRWTVDRAGKALQIALGSVIFRDTSQQLTSIGTWTVMGGRFFGPALLALAILAIRARVKR
jgi:hypothetical protein